MRKLSRPRHRALAPIPCIATLLTATYGLLPTASYGQDLFVTENRTVAGNNPINIDYGKNTPTK